MDRRPLGRTGLEVGAVGWGTSALGDMPDTYGYGVDEARARATLHAVLDGPPTLVDTSNNYGMGRSEARVGAALRERGGLPPGFVLSTKLDRDMDTGRLDGDRARRSLEESLGRLGLDRVGLLHLHDPEHARDVREVSGAIEALMRMKEEGLADAVGLAMGRLDLMGSLLRDWPFDVALTHNRFTLLNRSAEALIDEAHARGVAVLNAAPYAGGVLAKGAGAMPRVTYQEAGPEALAPVRAVEAACARHGVAVGAAALRVSMRDPRVACTIVGVSRPERVAETLAWAAAKVPEALWPELEGLASAEDPEANREYRPG